MSNSNTDSNIENLLNFLTKNNKKSLSNLPENVLRLIASKLNIKNKTSLAVSSKYLYSKLKDVYILSLFSGTCKVSNLPEFYLGKIYTRGFPEGVSEVLVKNSKFKTVASYSKEYGAKKLESRIKYDVLTIKGKRNEKAFSINIFKTGNVTFTGGYPEDYKGSLETYPQKLLTDIIGYYSRFYINNVNIQVYLGGSIDLQKLANFSSNYGKVMFEPEIRPYLSFDRNFHYRIYASGIVQISKIITKKDISDSIKYLYDLIRLSGSQRKSKSSTTYKKPKKTRPQLRRNNQIGAGVISLSTTCPKDKRPTPYSFGGVAINGTYIRPNPQGFPCCYKIPLKKGYLKPKIIEDFKKLGIKIPALTRQIFDITLDNYNNRNAPTNVSGKNSDDLIFLDDPKVGFKIGTRQCSRWTLPGLVDIAKKMGIVGITGKEGKAEMCAIIRQEAINQGRLSDTKNIVKRGNVRFGGKRNASHYTKSNLTNKAMRTYGIRLNSSMPLKNMVQNLRNKVKEKQLRNMYDQYINEENRNFFWNAAKENLKNDNPRNSRFKLARMRQEINKVKNEAESSRMAEKRTRLKNMYNRIINTYNMKRLIPFNKVQQSYMNMNENTWEQSLLLNKEIEEGLLETNIPRGIPVQVIPRNRLIRLGLFEEL